MQSSNLKYVRVAVYLGLIAALVALAYSGLKATSANTDLTESQKSLMDHIGVRTSSARHLNSEYTDKQGRLLADPPTDPAKLLDPDTLVVAYGEDSDLDVQPINWNEFEKYLAEVTGKKVVAQEYINTANEVADVKDGKIQIVALHAADTPYLVNNAGFIPVAVVGTAVGAAGNHLDLAVATKSDIKTLADLKGRTVTSTRPTSITGHRAAVAVLLRDAGLRPDVDYFINYSLGQTRSIQGLVSGDYEVVALSDDKLQSLLKSDRVKRTDFRLIYESKVIPRFTIGYIYNLQPNLAAKIQQAILEFKNESGPKAEGADAPMRFFPTDYKTDFEFVRRIDESFEPRFGAKVPKTKDTASAPTDSNDN